MALSPSNARTPRRLSRGASSLYTACPQELLRKHAASHLLFSVDLCAERRCPAMDSSWNVLWGVLALISLCRVSLRIRAVHRSGWVLLFLLLFRLLWISFSFVTHIAPFNTSMIWVPPGGGRRIGERMKKRPCDACSGPVFPARDPCKAFRKRCHASTEPYDWSQLNSFGAKSGSPVLRTVREPVNTITPFSNNCRAIYAAGQSRHRCANTKSPVLKKSRRL